MFSAWKKRFADSKGLLFWFFGTGILLVKNCNKKVAFLIFPVKWKKWLSSFMGTFLGIYGSVILIEIFIEVSSCIFKALCFFEP